MSFDVLDLVGLIKYDSVPINFENISSSFAELAIERHFVVFIFLFPLLNLGYARIAMHNVAVSCKPN